MRREERVRVQGPVLKQPDGMSHRGLEKGAPRAPRPPQMHFSAALPPKGNGRDGFARGTMQACVSVAVCLDSALCVVCCVPVAEGHLSFWCWAAAVQGRPGDAPPLCLRVPPKFSLGPGPCASGPWSGGDDAGTCIAEVPCTLPHCSGLWAVELLLYTASLPWGSGQWISFCSLSLPGGSGQWDTCCTLPHCLGAVGSGTPAVHCHTAWGQWAVGHLLYTATLPGGSGQWDTCCTLPHCRGAVGSGTPAVHCLTAWGQWAVGHLLYTASLPGGSGQWDTCCTLPHCRGAVGSGTPAVHCHTAGGQWAVGHLLYTASLPGGSGQWDTCCTLPHCRGAVGSGTPAVHCHTAGGQWAVGHLLYTASLPGGSGQWDTCCTLPHCRGAVGSGTPAVHCLTAGGQWAVGHLLYTASLPGGSGQWDTCCTLPHCRGAVGSGTPAVHCLTAGGQWAVGHLLYTASLPGGSGQWDTCCTLPHCLGAVGLLLYTHAGACGWLARPERLLALAVLLSMQRPLTSFPPAGVSRRALLPRRHQVPRALQSRHVHPLQLHEVRGPHQRAHPQCRRDSDLRRVHPVPWGLQVWRWPGEP